MWRLDSVRLGDDPNPYAAVKGGEFEGWQNKVVAFRREVIEAARKRILFLPHAIRQMSRPDRMITGRDVRRVVMRGEIIEDYPEDVRGHSCLMFGLDLLGRAIHVVCSPKREFLAIITAYTPEPDEWDPSFKLRKKQ